jgi:hypothetical protein
LEGTYGVEALWEDYELCACFCGFEDFGTRVGEVEGFIGAGSELDETELEGLF